MSREDRKSPAAIILAAGKSTRMKTDRPKVLHEICGRPMLDYVLGACRANGMGRILVVVGYGMEEIVEAYSGQNDLTWVEQNEQKGTGHAAMVCEPALKDFDGTVAVIAGDMPLVRPETLSRLLKAHENGGDAVTMATTMLDDPSGYGRILRDEEGQLAGIVEHRDCTPQQLGIRECNPSYYCFQKRDLFEALSRIDNNNAKREYYITDAIQVIIKSGRKATAPEAIDAEEATGINSRRDLATVGRILQERIQDEHMERGVTVVDPQNTWIEWGVEIEADAIIEPFTFIERSVKIGRGCRVGPFAYVRGGTVLEAGATRHTDETRQPVMASARARAQAS